MVDRGRKLERVVREKGEEEEKREGGKVKARGKKHGLTLL